MDGLPFIPGFRFKDITKKDYHLSRTYSWKNGYPIPKEKVIGIGKAPLDVDSILYAKTSSNTGYDPTLTYGKAKDPPKSRVDSHYNKYSDKCLSFEAYTKSTVLESSVETYRVRRVKITYFLVDDTLAIFEPVVQNAGYPQGCILKRGTVPNPNRKNRTWHWSDFNNGVELSIYGIVYRLCSCDSYTKQFLSMQGIAIASEEPIPNDPYIISRNRKLQRYQSNGVMDVFIERYLEDDKLKRFLIYDGKVLRFYAAWDDDGSDVIQKKYFIILYYLADDKIEIFESKEGNNMCGKDAFPVFLCKMKLPKDRTLLPANFPSIYLECSKEEIKDYYEPKDFIIGNIISVFGRRFLVYDCDRFTRSYFKEELDIDQPDPIKVIEVNDSDFSNRAKTIPPYTGIGDPDDTRQNCLSLMPKPPRTYDFVTYVLNSDKKLRFKLKLMGIREDDKFREFIMTFCLGNDHITIQEIASGKNSGFGKGKFMSSIRLRKPGTSVDDQKFYGTKDFALGAQIHVRGIVFIITGLDLWTYNYMNNHPEMFTKEAIEGAQKYIEDEGLLNKQETTTIENVNKNLDVDDTKNLFGKEVVVEKID